ncbi:TIGR03086 family metal-binding protein [Streptomyces physcomitrii]|uniref:TIGR03086 family metal-binding protein n=1 Tax=Streptomyces physcomitrii TaxID=2724184 RepID=UPI003440C64F
MSDLPKMPSFSAPSRGIADYLAAAADHCVRVVHGIADEDLGRPTPCPDYDVRRLTDHLIQMSEQFQLLARKEDSDFGTTPGNAGVRPDWREHFARECEGLVAAWAEPGAEEGTTGSLEMPAATVGRMALLDLAVHGWDLARATEQGYVPDPGGLGVVRELRETMAAIGPTGRSMGAFGPAVQAPANATEWDELLAETGRDPHWSRG